MLGLLKLLGNWLLVHGADGGLRALRKTTWASHSWRKSKAELVVGGEGIVKR